MEGSSALTFDELLKAAKQCSRGVKWKDSIANWVHPRNIALNCLKLKQELDAGTYKLGKYVVFSITVPKKRTIRSPKFRDRVVQRAMCNNGLYDDLTRGNIYDNAACQNGKGTTFAMDRLECLLQRHWRKHGNEGWVLRLDIHHFFDSLPHDRLKAMVDRKVSDPEYRRLVHDIIDSFSDPGIGLGSQISQLLAISYLSDFDHRMKEKWRIKCYVRYSDDIVIVHDDKEYLKRVWQDVVAELGRIGLELNPKSTLHPLRHGVRFLKFRYTLTDTGRVVRTLDRQNITHIRRRLGKLLQKVREGTRGMEDVQHSFMSWKSHAELGNSHIRIRRMRQWLAS